MKLNQLRDNKGARKKPITVGRGIGSGKGKTSGRGVKGQKARTGVSIKGFEGGQTPLIRRMPKRGFNNIFARDFAEVTLSRLQAAVDSGKLKAGTLATADLVKAGVAHKTKDGVRVLAKGELKSKLTLTVEGVTAGAKAAIEKAGGTVTLKAIREKPRKTKQAAAIAAKAAKAK